MTAKELFEQIIDLEMEEFSFKMVELDEKNNEVLFYESDLLRGVLTDTDNLTDEDGYTEIEQLDSYEVLGFEIKKDLLTYRNTVKFIVERSEY